MPASPIKWSAFAGPEVEQVFGLTYGTKRKTGQDGGADFEECMASEPHLPRKRLCVWQQQQHQLVPQQPVSADVSAMTDNDDQMEMEETQKYQISQPQNNNSILSQQIYQTVSQSQQHGLQQSNMLMNINDDDCCDMEDYTSAYDAMDGEGAVDYSQYGITTQASSSRVTSFQHEGYCFGAETSPNSGNVKCYCRPSWDTMLDNKSYNSDVY